MSKELVTRGPFREDGMTVAWALTSGLPAEIVARGLRPRTIPGIQLRVTSGAYLMDVHEAGDLYAGLEAHMENVGAPVAPAPMAPEERDRLLRLRRIHDGNLKAVPEKDWRKGPLDVIDGTADAVDPEFLAAMEDVVEAWTNNGPNADPRHPVRTSGVEGAFPALAAALDRLAALNA